MTQRSYQDRISALAKKQEQLRIREKELRRRCSEEERRKRTRRLIELGAIVESVLGRPTVDEDKERLQEFLISQNRRGDFFSSAMNKPPKGSASPDG